MCRSRTLATVLELTWSAAGAGLGEGEAADILAAAGALAGGPGLLAAGAGILSTRLRLTPLSTCAYAC